MNAIPPAMYVTILRKRSSFTKVVARHLWDAFWRDGGLPLAAAEERLRWSRDQGGVPSTLIALRSGHLLGTVSLVESDREELPQLTPWISALWVDPAHRRKGVGDALLGAAAAQAFLAGHPAIHACDRSERGPYYLKRGWKLLQPFGTEMSIYRRAR